MRKHLFPGIEKESNLLLLQTTTMSILKDQPEKIQSEVLMKFFFRDLMQCQSTGQIKNKGL
jgi:hypothetical protein